VLSTLPEYSFVELDAIAAVYIGFAVADGRRNVIAVESGSIRGCVMSTVLARLVMYPHKESR
jgi:hypothetical protein